MAYAWEAPWNEPAPDEEPTPGLDYDHVAPECAADELASYLVTLKHMGVLSATQTCILAFWCNKAGVRSELLGKLAFPPGRQSGHYSRKFDIATKSGVDKSDYYVAAMPGFCRCDASRVNMEVPMKLAYEVFISDNNSEGVDVGKLGAMQLPPIYHNHKVVRSNPGCAVIPAALYLDGVPFTRQDGVLGFWCHNLLTNARHCLVVLRKSEMCACGCRGWDSLYVVWAVLAWAFRALANGVCPLERHDGTPWANDVARLAVAGAAIPFRVALLYVKCDMAEWPSSIGLPGATSKLHCCPFCTCTPDEFGQVVGLTILAVPCEKKSHDQYLDACAVCEHWVWVTAEVRADVRARLAFVKGDQAKGRSLMVDMPDLGLRKNDRLEPSPHMPNTFEFDTKTPPFWALFWRTSVETQTRHRNPFFDIDIGVTIEASLAIDFLHDCSLGNFKFAATALIHTLVAQNAFDSARLDKDSLWHNSATRIRSELFAWYGRERARGAEHVQVQDLTEGMIRGELGTHGAETHGVLRFLPCLVDRFGAALEQKAIWLRMIRALICILDLYKEHNDVMPVNACQQFVDATKTYVLDAARLNIKAKPKTHGLVELAARLHAQGAPKAFATWRDEGLNHNLAMIAQKSHRLVWHWRVLNTMEHAMERICSGSTRTSKRLRAE